MMVCSVETVNSLFAVKIIFFNVDNSNISYLGHLFDTSCFNCLMHLLTCYVSAMGALHFLLSVGSV